MEEYKFFSKRLLKEANDAAHREKRSRCIDPSILESLPLDFVYYVVDFFYHKKNEVRLMIRIDESNIKQLDMSITRYESLPSIIYYDNGESELKFSDRPYPNGREWLEKEEKRPIRKQGQFRKEVLAAYNNCCAICNLSEKSLLRAVHILDVKDGGLDTVNNGIALCVNHEIAFDRGIVKINPDYTIEAPTLLDISVETIKLPTKASCYPSSEFLKQKQDLFKEKKD